MLQGALAGLAAGGLYAVLAVCLSLMSTLVRVVNLAQAATGMLGAFIAVWLRTQLGLPLVLTFVLGILIGTVISALIGLIAQSALAEADVTTRSAMTVGPLLLLISLSFILFGTRPQPFEPILRGVALRVGGVGISQTALVMVALAVLVAAVASLVLRRTRVGTRLRALAERPTTAELLGIPSRPLAISVWAVTGAISAAAIMVVAPSQSNDATSLAMLIVPASAAALLGAFRNLWLAVLGGLLLGMLAGVVAQVGQLSLVRDFVPFLVIVVLLLWSQRKERWDAAR